MNGCIVNILVITLCIGIAGAASAGFTIQPGPLPPDASPHEVLERLHTHRFDWMGSSGAWPLLDRIEREPDKYAPVVAEMADSFPERVEDWDPPHPFLPAFYPQIFERLGVARTDPILVKYFRDGYRLYKQADEQLATIRQEAGRPPYENEELQARFEVLQRQHHAAMSVMTSAVSQLRQMNSPALVDDMLKFWEAGYIDRRTNLPRYPLMFAQERPDVIPRLKALMQNPEIDRSVRMEIERALVWHTGRLREGEANEQQDVSGMDPERIIRTLVIIPPDWPRQFKEVYDRIRREPEIFAPLIARRYTYAESLEEWRNQTRSLGTTAIRHLHAHQAVHLLGPEHAEPIVDRYFHGAYRLYVEVTEEINALRGKPVDEHQQEAVAEQMRELQELKRMFWSAMRRAIQMARELHSPVLVDGMLEFWEAGFEDGYVNQAKYLLLFADERPDIIPRLRAIMNDPATPRDPRNSIRRALERHAAEQVKAETEDRESEPPPGAPDGEEPARPR